MARTALSGRLDWQLANVVSTPRETPRVISLRLESAAWMGHLPGQHVDVRLTAEDGYQAQRSYSVSSAPEAGVLELTVEDIADGEVSPYLTEVLKPADQLELRGPIGGYFTWTEADGGPLLLVAGGSGIAPLMSMLRYRAGLGSDVPTTLLYSSRSWEEIIYREELERLAADATLRVLHTLTRAQPPGWGGYDRRIDAAMLDDVIGPEGAEGFAFVCGPTQLVEQVANILVVHGYPAARVKTERFGPTGG